MRERYLEALKGRVGKARLGHSLRVAAMAEGLAKKHGADPERAYLAGLVHDFGKELPDGVLLEQVGSKRPLDPVEKAFPHILHAEAGALGVETELGQKDHELLSAVACHTLGGAGLGALAKILFISDYLEPERDFPGAEGLRAALDGPLDKAYLACVRHKMEHLMAKGLPLHRRLMDAWNEGAGVGSHA